jgi:hypothetical protein
MSAQHAPHTPSLWRQVLSLPHTRLGWWAVGLASPALILTAYFIVTYWAGGHEYSLELLLVWPLSAVAGAVAGLIALVRDRSWLVWVAQVNGVLLFAYFIWGYSSWLLRHDTHDSNPWVAFAIAVLIWAVSAGTAVFIGRKESGKVR